MGPSLRLTDNARRALRASRVKSGHAGLEVSASRILLALRAERRSLAAQLLAPTGAAWERSLVSSERACDGDGLILAERELLEMALRESQRQEDSYIGTEHLLLALSRRPVGRAPTPLDAHNISAERIDAELEEILRSRVSIARRLGMALGRTVAR